VTITALPAPLRHYRKLWRSDKATIYLGVYLEDGAVVSDVMTVPGDTSDPSHYTISGVDLEETLTAWGSGSRESPMFIPGEHGRPPTAVRVDQVEPRIDPVLDQVEVPTQQVAVPDPLPSAPDPIPDPQYRPDTYRETPPSRRWGPGPGRSW
jgi:hypothetical protein